MKRTLRKYFLATAASLSLLLCGTTLAGTPGDTSTSTVTYCQQVSCVRVTYVMVLNANHEWVVVDIREETFVVVQQEPDRDP